MSKFDSFMLGLTSGGGKLIISCICAISLLIIGYNKGRHDQQFTIDSYKRENARLYWQISAEQDIHKRAEDDIYKVLSQCFDKLDEIKGYDFEDEQGRHRWQEKVGQGKDAMSILNTNNLLQMVRDFNHLLYEVEREYRSVIYIHSITQACEEVLNKFEEFKKVGVEVLRSALSPKEVISPKEIMYVFQAIVEQTKDFVQRYENERLVEQEVITLSIFKDTLINNMIKYLASKPEEAAELLSELLNAPAR